MPKQYDYAVVIGRCQPFHLGHAKLLDHALEIADQVVVVLGSAKAARSVKNPFTVQERQQMIEMHLDDTNISADVSIIGVRDYFYNDSLWVTELQEKVRQVINNPAAKVALVGHQKDDSSYYLNLFPGWKFEAHEPRKVNGVTLNATDVRRLYFEALFSWRSMVPSATEQVLDSLARTGQYNALAAQYLYLQDYPKQWGKGPFVTVDAVVTHRGHVLVIERGQQPGKGLYALPGGFLNLNERIVDGALRELHEETNIRVDPELLPRAIVSSQVFDHPNRSERGRTITHAFHINLDGVPYGLFDGHLPSVKAGDDASRAFWMPLYDAFAQEETFYEDHIHIIRHFVTRT